MSDPRIVTLARPIMAHGEETGSLEFREPTGRDIRELGLPYCAEVSEGNRTKIHFEARALARYVSHLAGIPLTSVDAMALGDWQACMGAVMDFFGGAPDAAASPRDSSIA